MLKQEYGYSRNRSIPTVLKAVPTSQQYRSVNQKAPFRDNKFLKARLLTEESYKDKPLNRTINNDFKKPIRSFFTEPKGIKPVCRSVIQASTEGRIPNKKLSHFKKFNTSLDTTKTNTLVEKTRIVMDRESDPKILDDLLKGIKAVKSKDSYIKIYQAYLTYLKRIPLNSSTRKVLKPILEAYKDLLDSNTRSEGNKSKTSQSLNTSASKQYKDNSRLKTYQANSKTLQKPPSNPLCTKLKDTEEALNRKTQEVTALQQKVKSLESQLENGKRASGFNQSSASNISHAHTHTNTGQIEQPDSLADYLKRKDQKEIRVKPVRRTKEINSFEVNIQNLDDLDALYFHDKHESRGSSVNFSVPRLDLNFDLKKK